MSGFWKLPSGDPSKASMGMEILVMGGAGFVGSAVIRHIIQNTDHSIINVDKLTYAGNLENSARAMAQIAVR